MLKLFLDDATQWSAQQKLAKDSLKLPESSKLNKVSAHLHQNIFLKARDPTLVLNTATQFRLPTSPRQQRINHESLQAYKKPFASEPAGQDSAKNCQGLRETSEAIHATTRGAFTLGTLPKKYARNLCAEPHTHGVELLAKLCREQGLRRFTFAFLQRLLMLQMLRCHHW